MWAWRVFNRDREIGKRTFLSTFRGLGVSDGCPYHTPGLEAIPDKK